MDDPVIRAMLGLSAGGALLFLYWLVQERLWRRDIARDAADRAHPAE